MFVRKKRFLQQSKFIQRDDFSNFTYFFKKVKFDQNSATAVRFHDENQIQTQISFLIMNFVKKNDAILIFSMNFADLKNMIHDRNIRVEISIELSFNSRRERSLSIAFI